MGIRNSKKEVLCRLEHKTLDARFLQIVVEGLGCSPFEGEAVLSAVKEVYFPFLEAASPSAPPGKVTLVAVCADEPAGKPVAACEKRTVCLTVHRGAQDDRLLQEEGPQAFRRARIPDLCQEALSQGALLTREDLAAHVFFVSTRTISRDLAAFRTGEPAAPLPLRSLVHDIGPVLTHRVQIVSLALEGKTTREICQAMRHSPLAVANYVSTFTRCAQLARRGMESGQIAFLLRRSRGLVERYLELLEACEGDENRRYHLEELLRLGQPAGKKKDKGGCTDGA
jgi:DNA-binding CsgD family transcriptional regulator